VAGQLQRSRKLLGIRGLNPNHNHDLKYIFMSAAINASISSWTVTNLAQDCPDRFLAKQLCAVCFCPKPGGRGWEKQRVRVGLLR
jgi:hypothetical protein